MYYCTAPITRPTFTTITAYITIHMHYYAHLHFYTHIIYFTKRVWDPKVVTSRAPRHAPRPGVFMCRFLWVMNGLVDPMPRESVICSLFFVSKLDGAHVSKLGRAALSQRSGCSSLRSMRWIAYIWSERNPKPYVVWLIYPETNTRWTKRREIHCANTLLRTKTNSSNICTTKRIIP